MCREYITMFLEEGDRAQIIEYEDEGFSGKNTKRPMFQQMMQDMQEKHFDYLVCYKLDRLGRNLADLANLMEDLNRDKDHVHFLVQSVPKYSPTQIVRVIKSITAREVFAQCPDVKKKLWGGEFWSDGFYVATVSAHGNEEVVAKYVKNQGKEYNKLYRGAEVEGQLSFSDYV